MTEKILEIKELKTNFYTYEGVVKALDGIQLEVNQGETVGLVGETGCGKSVTSLSILRLILPPGRIEKGKIIFKLKQQSRFKDNYVDLLSQSEKFMRTIRGNEISMIFQEASSALNPVYTVDEQISESFLLHQKSQLYQEAIREIDQEINQARISWKKRTLGLEKTIFQALLNNQTSLPAKILGFLPGGWKYRGRIKRQARKKSIEILAQLGIANPENIVDRYPHELSGGMQQRVVIAMALACNPNLLIADEPTSNLDVTIQAQILDLIRDLKRKFKSSVLFITHDLGVVAEMCDRVAVMYAGNICEIAEVKELFRNPLHPYTKALLNAVPRGGKTKLESIEGNVPNLINPPSGCRFHPRCALALSVCSQVNPPLLERAKEHFLACHYYGEKNK